MVALTSRFARPRLRRIYGMFDSNRSRHSSGPSSRRILLALAGLAACLVALASSLNSNPATAQNLITISFEQAHYQVWEDESSIDIPLQLSSPLVHRGTVTFTLESKDGHCQWLYYVCADEYLFIRTGATSATLTIWLEDNNQQTAKHNAPVDTITITISDKYLPYGLSLGARTTTTLSILENEPAHVYIKNRNLSLREGGASGNITLALGRPLQQDTTITLAPETNGNSAAPSDYTISPGTVVITAEQLEAAFTISANADNVIEDDEQVAIRIGSVTGSYATPHPFPSESTATITILDDTPTVQMSTTTYTVLEGQPVEVSVELSRSRSAPSMIPLTVSDGTAEAGTDYTTPTLSSITIPAGNTTGSLSINTIPDSTAEDDKTFTVAINTASLPAETPFRGLQEATITITDSSPRVQMGSATFSARGGEQITVKVILSAPALTQTVIPLTLTDGTALAGTDYIMPPTSSVTIAQGETAGTLQIDTTSDMLIEEDKTFTVAIDTANLPADIPLRGVESSTITIFDDDYHLCLATSTLTVNENTDFTYLDVNVRGSTRYPKDYTLEISPKTAEGHNIDTIIIPNYRWVSAGRHISPPPQIPSGVETLRFSVYHIDDRIAEPHDSYTVTLSGSSSEVPADCHQTTTVHFKDNEPRVFFADGTRYVEEGETARILIHSSIYYNPKPPNRISASVVQPDSSIEGIATPGEDFRPVWIESTDGGPPTRATGATAYDPGWVWTNKLPSVLIGHIKIQAVDDGIPHEGIETFTVKIDADSLPDHWMLDEDEDKTTFAVHIIPPRSEWPIISLSKAGNITEGEDVVINVQADRPTPGSLTVMVFVNEYTPNVGRHSGAVRGPKVVTLDNSGSGTLSIPTTLDGVDRRRVLRAWVYPLELAPGLYAQYHRIPRHSLYVLITDSASD